MPHEFKINKSKKKKVIGIAVVIIFLGLIAFYGYRLLFLKNFAAQSKAQIYSQLEEARAALANFDPEGARDSFTAIDEELKDVETEASRFGILKVTGWFSGLKNIPAMLKNLTGISGTAIHLSEDISFLKENGLQLMLNDRGPEFIERLKIFGQKLAALTDYLNSLDKNKNELDLATQKKLIQLRAQIDSTNKALTALIKFLDSEKPRQILLLFQNPSEMRPAGGFIGSYAHVTLEKANINNIDVRDIYDPDGQLDLKIIPPKILQHITPKWGARDANWFFDFPTSAKKVIYFLNNSKIYSEKEITFNAAIAINTNVLTDIIGLIGEIDLPEYEAAITAENFLIFVQKEVESGEDKKANQPKKILQVLTPKLLNRLNDLGADKKQELVKLFDYHASRKNIMVYVDDSDLELYAKTVGLTGSVATLSNKAVSEYLAVVNTNIAGGKSDAFVSQQINLRSTISETGEIINELTVRRAHTGAKEKDWWYRAANKNYMQIYTTVGSRAIDSSGRDKWPTSPQITYKTFVPDPDVEAIESTEYYLSELGLDRFIAFDKTVFAAWLNTPAGKTKTFTLTYKNPRKLDPTASIPYEFIFEKQSGASTTLSVAISAPPKYKWKESNSGTLTYESSDPPGRIRLRQTLVPIQ